MAKEDYLASGLTVKNAIQVLLENDLAELFATLDEVTAARDGEATLLAQINSLQAAIAAIGTELVNDTSPQLGGDLDLNSHKVAGVTATELGYLSGLTGSIEPRFIPPGGIIMWSGAISAIPSGWYLCDGTNSTPDLTDRFVVHADADSGGTNNVGDTGGNNSLVIAHTHTSGTLATDNESAHRHQEQYYDSGSTVPAQTGTTTGSAKTIAGSAVSNAFSTSLMTAAGEAHNHTVSGSVASAGTGTDSRPKFYALAYIMKG